MITGAGDGPCASLGAGATGDVACLTLGSSATLRLLTSRPLLDLDARSTVLALDERAYVLSIPVSNAGFALEWGRQTLGLRTLADLDHAAATGRADPSVIVLPYVTGERYPYWDRRLRPSVTTPDADVPALARALITGIACTLLRALRHAQALGAHPTSIMVNGGAAANTSLAAITAALLDTDLRACPGDALDGAIALAGTSPDRAAGVPIRADAILAADRGLAEETYTRFIAASDRHAGAP